MQGSHKAHTHPLSLHVNIFIKVVRRQRGEKATAAAYRTMTDQQNVDDNAHTFHKWQVLAQWGAESDAGVQPAS